MKKALSTTPMEDGVRCRSLLMDTRAMLMATRST